MCAIMSEEKEAMHIVTIEMTPDYYTQPSRQQPEGYAPVRTMGIAPVIC